MRIGKLKNLTKIICGLSFALIAAGCSEGREVLLVNRSSKIVSVSFANSRAVSLMPDEARVVLISKVDQTRVAVYSDSKLFRDEVVTEEYFQKRTVEKIDVPVILLPK
ncbi:MAG: hypothetical protein J0L72_02075 [Armatimonadetes bacterium]|nr:hypothetical protein [Armatimonadota bacterium]